MTAISWRKLFMVAGVLATAMATVALSGPWSVAEAAVAETAPRPTAGIDPLDDPDAPSTPVWAIVEANGRYYIGGDFQNVAGESQPYLAAIDVATGRLDQTWRPQVNGRVLSIAVAPDGSAVYVGGNFNKINNAYPNRIAKLDPVTGAVDTSFDPDATAAVEALVTDGTSVWAGGVFTTIGGVAQPHLAKMDTSGVVDTSFAPTLDGNVLDLELEGSRLYMAGNFTTIDAVDHKRIASVDAETGVADAWFPESSFKIYDVSVKPDGTILYAAGAGSLGAGGNSLTAWDTTTGEQLWRRVNSGDFQAVEATNELVYIGTHGEYVYINNDGPFLEDDANPNAIRRNKLAAFDPVTGALDAWNPGANSIWGVWALHVGPSGLAVGGDFITIGGVVQPHFAVFDGPTDGTTPILNPPVTVEIPDSLPVEFVGATSFNGQGSNLPVTPTPLLRDGDVGVAVVSVAQPNTIITAPPGWTLAGTQVAGSMKSEVFTKALTTADLVESVFMLDGAASLKADVTMAVFRYADAAAPIDVIASAPELNLWGQHRAPDVSTAGPATVVHYWANRSGTGDSLAAPADEPTISSQVGLGGGHINSTMSLSTALTPGLVPGRVAIADVSTTSALGWSIAVAQDPTPPACHATLNADDTVLIDWDDVQGARNYTVRQNGGWLTTLANPAITEFIDAPAPGTYAYEVRASISGGRVDLVCTPSITIDDPPPVTQTCSAVLNADDSITLTWDSIVGENGYSVRRNGSYLAFAGNTLTYDNSPGNGTWDYIIRSKMDGVTTNTSCGTPITIDTPPPTQTCSAVLNADDSITLTWDPIVGENGYSVRRNGSYLAFAGNTLTYDNSPGNGTWDYIIRSKIDGVTTNTSCGTPITIDTPPPAGQTCSATVNADGSVSLTWDAIAGEDTYIVRRNDSWLATTGGLFYDDAFAQAGDSYVIRSRQGTTVNTPCL